MVSIDLLIGIIAVALTILVFVNTFGFFILRSLEKRIHRIEDKLMK